MNLSIDLQLSYEKDIVKNMVGLFSWFVKTANNACTLIKDAFTDVDFSNSIMVVHGDTVSTVMGAYLGKKLGMYVAHIEAGLRSHNWFSPFPEEIDRHLVSKISNLNFCPNEEALRNLSNAKGRNVNTVYNTLIDSLQISKKFPCENEIVADLLTQSYCVFIMHRQENLLQQKLVHHIVNQAVLASKNIKVIFILHPITNIALQKMDLLDKLRNNKNIILLDRVEYFDFSKLLINSQFVITDGGSNQEELYYMGKPTLIIRSSTERDEGLGHNALMYGGRIDAIDEFISNFIEYRRDEIIPTKSPSFIIANCLSRHIFDEKTDKKQKDNTKEGEIKC